MPKSRRTKTRRMDAAIAALTPLGFEKKDIRRTVNMLVKEYNDPESGWFFVEEDYYRLPIETMIKDQDEEQQRSNVVNEEQEKENEEQEEGDGAFEEATERENSGREIVQFEAGSSSNMALSGRGEYPADESALVNLADCCEMVHGIELSQLISSSSVPPEGTPSLTWISEEEEEEEEEGRRQFVVKRAPRSAPKRGPSHGWISDEEEDDD